jgi:hypothetical protein
MYDSFCKYQTALLAEFDRLREEYSFDTVDASAEAKTVCSQLRNKIHKILEPELPKAVVPNPNAELIEALAQRVVGNLMPKRNVAGDHSNGEKELVGHPLAAYSAGQNGRIAV